MAQNTYLQHPRFGFTEQLMVDEVLTNLSLTGVSVSRVAGTRLAVVIGIFTLTSGVGEVQLLLEGSNDGANWFTVGSTASGVDNFTTNGQTVVLNAAGTSLVDLQRFDRLRVRAVIVSGAPVFSLQTFVSGISGDSEKFLFTDTFTRDGATPTSQSAAQRIRPSGTVLTTVQITSSGVVLDGATAFNVVLQGSPDLGTTWIDIATVPVTGNTSTLMSVNSDDLFSLGAYGRFRFQVVDDGVAGAAASFTISAYMGLDSVDWTLDDDASGGGGGGGGSADAALILVQFGTPGAEAGNARTLPFQLLSLDGSPLLESRRVEIILYDTTLAGDLDLAMNAVFSAVGTGTAISVTGTNRITVATNAVGAGEVTITDTAVETVYATAVNPNGPQTVPQVVAQADQVALAFV